PAYLAYLVISWNPIYHLCDSFSQAFVHPYDSILPILLSGNYGTNTVNNAMPSIPKRIFTTSELDTFVNDPNSAMRVALRDNDNFDWAPQAPTRIFFCKGDTYVPYQNSCVAINKMRQNGCADCDTMDINPDLDHVPCAQYSILQAKQFFDRYRFIDCTNGIDNISEQAIVSVYPNPAHDRFSVEIYQAGEFASASMYDAMGRLVKSVALGKGVNAISTDALATGVYLVRVSDEKGLNKVTRVTVTK
ncbi:MAG: T9SS type A sorting domain-containing protein, partial [Bacteroidetes bacterium]|nr:T9SS type A sorting domain-containing protein [Bacteroidota bacterium]